MSQLNLLEDVKHDQRFIKVSNIYEKLKKKALSKPKIDPVPWEVPEEYYGNIEYKLKLIPETEDVLIRRTTQMLFRIKEGNGKAFYKIGVSDNGEPTGITDEQLSKSLGSLFYMARSQNAEIKVTKVEHAISNLWFMAQVTRDVTKDITATKITLLGSEDSGKTTLLGVLSTGVPDNGKGSARINILRHQHEFEQGHSTSIFWQLLGFDSSGNITNYDQFRTVSWDQVVQQSAKMLVFIDIGGSEKYASTMIRGICSHYPDYALLVLDATQGEKKLPIDQFQLALRFNVPIAIVITKADLISNNELKSFKEVLSRMVDEQTQSYLFPIESPEQVIECCTRILEENKQVLSDSQLQQASKKMIPMFSLACTNLASLALLKQFLCSLPSSEEKTEEEEKIDTKLEVHLSRKIKYEDKTIYTGIISKGRLSRGQTVLLGPSRQGEFQVTQVTSLQCNRVNVDSAVAGQLCTCILKVVEGDTLQDLLYFKPGMNLLDITSKPKATWTISAEFSSLHQVKIKLRNNSQFTVYSSSSIQQSARLILHKDWLSNEELKRDPLALSRNQSKQSTGQEEVKQSYKANSEFTKYLKEIEFDGQKKQRVILQFIHHPEYLTLGTQLIINCCPNQKLLGKVTHIFFDMGEKFKYCKVNSERKQSLILDRRCTFGKPDESPIEDSAEFMALPLIKRRSVSFSEAQVIQDTQEDKSPRFSQIEATFGLGMLQIQPVKPQESQPDAAEESGSQSSLMRQLQ